MSSSLPETFDVRPAIEADAEALGEIFQRAELDLRGRVTSSAADIRAWLRYVDLSTGSWVIEDDGEIVAGGVLIRHGEAPQFGAVVRPDRRGEGLGSALLDLGEQAVRADGSKAIRAGAPVEDVAAARLLASRGYRDARHYYTMMIPLDEETPEPQPDQGIALGTMELHEAEAFHFALNEAFADEWGWTPMPFDEWWKLRIEAADFDPSIWFVARDADELAAVARCEKLFGGGYVGAIGVRPAWRRRGIALALLQFAFAEFRKRGEPHVRLDVDAENPTGATRLYERGGMRVESEDVVFERELA
jgi:ribosomal protein S18 acetylase RimI-like enzyme